jgi:phenylacetate-CoA ligase
LFDFQRELAIKMLECDLYEKYGSREIGTVAVECSQLDGLHLVTESVYIEIEPASEFAQLNLGRIIVTDLRNKAMPLIRYEVGDLATIDDAPCACGSAFPRLKSIQGRAIDILYRRDGTAIAGLEATDPITYSGIDHQVQIVQNEPGEIEVKVVGLEEVPQQQLHYIRKKLLGMLGNGGEVSFTSVDSINRDESGKFRYTISNVKSRGS